MIQPRGKLVIMCCAKNQQDPMWLYTHRVKERTRERGAREQNRGALELNGNVKFICEIDDRNARIFALDGQKVTCTHSINAN